MVQRSGWAGCRRAAFFAGCLTATWLFCAACGAGGSIGRLTWSDNEGGDTLRRTTTAGQTITARFNARNNDSVVMSLGTQSVTGGLLVTLDPLSVPRLGHLPVDVAVEVPAGTPPGDYSLQIIGSTFVPPSNREQTDPLRMSVTVEEPSQQADFDLSVQPDAHAFTRPNTIQAFEYEVTPRDGFTGTVAIAVEVPAALFLNEDPDPASLVIGPTDAAGGVFELYWDGEVRTPQTVTVVATAGDQRVERELAITFPQPTR